MLCVLGTVFSFSYLITVIGAHCKSISCMLSGSHRKKNNLKHLETYNGWLEPVPGGKKPKLGQSM